MPLTHEFFGKKNQKTQIIEYFTRGQYHFTAVSEATVKRTLVRKKVYIGQFLSTGENANSRAPKGCKLDTPYCLKCYDIDVPIANEDRPQNREYLDLLPFEGEHIREIISMDENAERMVEYLLGESREIEGDAGSMICMTIEPCYTPFDPKLFPDTADKLSCMLQIIEGLRELYRYENKNLWGITAHRDLKFKNVMLSGVETKNLTVKLIDFATVKASYNAEADATAEGAFSPNNTAPEDLFEEIPVGEKTDVFALGLMLAEILGIWSYKADNGTYISNPLHILFEIDKVTDMKDFYEKVIYKNANGENTRWLENELRSLTPCWDSLSGLSQGVKNLFESATRLIPEKRLSLQEFEDQLRRIISSAGKVTEEKESKKFSIFLFDTQNLYENRERFIDAATRILEEGDKSLVLIDYHSTKEPQIQAYHGKLTKSSDETVIGKYRLKSYIEDLKDTSLFGRSYSELLGLLYHLSGYISHDKRAELFSGEIHIFTHTPPTQNTCCRLLWADESVPGGTEIVTLSGADVANMLGGAKIYVHSPKGATEEWYKTMFI